MLFGWYHILKFQEVLLTVRTALPVTEATGRQTEWRSSTRLEAKRQSSLYVMLGLNTFVMVAYIQMNE
jgi:hypothetical protein